MINRLDIAHNRLNKVLTHKDSRTLPIESWWTQIKWHNAHQPIKLSTKMEPSKRQSSSDQRLKKTCQTVPTLLKWTTQNLTKPPLNKKSRMKNQKEASLPSPRCSQKRRRRPLRYLLLVAKTKSQFLKSRNHRTQKTLATLMRKNRKMEKLIRWVSHLCSKSLVPKSNQVNLVWIRLLKMTKIEAQTITIWWMDLQDWHQCKWIVNKIGLELIWI